MMEGFYWKKTNCQAVLALASVMCAIIFRGKYIFLLDMCCGRVWLCDCAWRVGSHMEWGCIQKFFSPFLLLNRYM